jgi:hypothetical protein
MKIERELLEAIKLYADQDWIEKQREIEREQRRIEAYREKAIRLTESPQIDLLA